jgi:alpha-tubulin suppressor-like RCC1 family protein
MPFAVRRSLMAVIAAAMTCVVLVVAAGLASARAARSSTVDHWGTFFGQARPGGDDTSLRPVEMTVPGRIVQIGTSNSTDYALLSNGELYAWGQGSHGQLGDGRLHDSFARPVRVRFPAGVKIASMPADVMPFDSALAIDTTGHVWGWGFNYGGELCRGSATTYSRPVRLPFAHVTAAAGASDHAIFDAGGKLYTCGTNVFGELGDGNAKTSYVPIRVKHIDGAQVTAVVASYGNTGALLKNGDYYDWGLDSRGQLGNGTVGQSSDLPVQVSLPGRVRLASEGGSLGNNGQTLVLLANGKLYAWGNDTYGQLGDGATSADQPSPVPFSAPDGVTYQSLATSGATSYAISTTGEVYAWGASSHGQTGDGSRTPVLTPVKVDSDAIAISATAADVAVLVRQPATRAAGG